MAFRTIYGILGLSFGSSSFASSISSSVPGIFSIVNSFCRDSNSSSVAWCFSVSPP